MVPEAEPETEVGRETCLSLTVPLLELIKRIYFAKS